MKSRITYSEFLDWLEFLREEELRRTKTDFYLAQIAAEVRRGLVKNPKTVKITDFFIQKPTEEQAEMVKESKKRWLQGLKVKTERN